MNKDELKQQDGWGSLSKHCLFSSASAKSQPVCCVQCLPGSTVWVDEQWAHYVLPCDGLRAASLCTDGFQGHAFIFLISLYNMCITISVLPALSSFLSQECVKLVFLCFLKSSLDFKAGLFFTNELSVCRFCRLWITAL